MTAANNDILQTTFSAVLRSSSVRSKSLPSSLFGRFICYSRLGHAGEIKALINFSGHRQGPPVLRQISKYLSKRLTAWQTLVVTMLWLYISRNFGKICGFESPEPLANLYNRSYFRATWVTTALDAGFWTAMRIKRKWIRDLASIVFTIYYLVAAEQADEKVRKVRGTLTVEHLRVSWNKPTTPYLSLVMRLTRPKLARYPPRKVLIPRPRDSSFREAVTAWLYFDEPLAAIGAHTKVILDIPGGGFVAMSPREHDDRLFAWAGRTGLPILSLDYKKAPEYPYPYSLNECYDVYRTLVSTRGRCLGLQSGCRPRIVITGDSAGGNLATGLTLMILQSGTSQANQWDGQEILPRPEGLILIYPCLDVNIGNWMTDEQMSLIQDRRTRRTNKNILRRKSEDYYKLTPETPLPSDNDEDTNASPPQHSDSSTLVESQPVTVLKTEPESEMAIRSPSIARQKATVASSKPNTLKTRLAVSSMISYFNDRILTPEMMRAMIILYVGPHNRPDFSTEYLLSPVLAPEALLAKFPRTYFLTGERDPLVDDTVIFAGRLRQAKYNFFIQRKELGLVTATDEFDEKDHVEVTLIPGISHGFLQFGSIFPEGWKHIFRCARWIEEIYGPDANPDEWQGSAYSPATPRTPYPRHHDCIPTDSSADDEDIPLTMTTIKPLKDTQGSRSNTSRETLKARRERKTQRASHRRDRSLVTLASEDDLLGRRMKGVAGGLMGMSVMDGVGDQMP